MSIFSEKVSSDIIVGFLGLTTTMETALVVAMIGAIALIFVVIFLFMSSKHRQQDMDATNTNGGWQPIGSTTNQQASWNQPLPSMPQQMMPPPQYPPTTTGSHRPVPQMAQPMMQQQPLPATTQQNGPPSYGNTNPTYQPQQMSPVYANGYQQQQMPQQNPIQHSQVPTYNPNNANAMSNITNPPQPSFPSLPGTNNMSQYPSPVQQQQGNPMAPSWMQPVPLSAPNPLPIPHQPADFKEIPPTLSTPPQWMQDSTPSWLQSDPSTSGAGQLVGMSQYPQNDSSRAMPNQPFVPTGMSIPTTETLGLKVEQGKDLGHMYEMRKAMLTIGRSRESDIFLEDLAVSRLHATILQTAPGAYALRDEGSANGTKVNGQAVDKYQTYPIQLGDRVQVGNNTTFIFTRV